MQALVQTVGVHPSAVLTSYWAIVEEEAVKPEVIVYICTTQSEKLTPILRRATAEISQHVFGFTPKTVCRKVNEARVLETVMNIKMLILNYKEKGYNVYVDITPSRKTLSASALKAAIEAKADGIYYLLLKNPQYIGEIYPYIPRHQLKLVKI